MNKEIQITEMKKLKNTNFRNTEKTLQKHKNKNYRSTNIQVTEIQ